VDTSRAHLLPVQHFFKFIPCRHHLPQPPRPVGRRSKTRHHWRQPHGLHPLGHLHVIDGILRGNAHGEDHVRPVTVNGLPDVLHVVGGPSAAVTEAGGCGRGVLEHEGVGLEYLPEHGQQTAAGDVGGAEQLPGDDEVASVWLGGEKLVK